MTAQTLSDSKLRRAYKRWNAGTAYNRQMKQLTIAQGFSHFAGTAFRMGAPDRFEWPQTSAQEIVSTLRKTSWLNDCIGYQLRERGIPLEEIVDGIECFRRMNVEAHQWARRLLDKYVSECDTSEPLVNDCSINEWLNATTLEMPELMRLHMDSPMLHGQIYLELEKLVVAAHPSENNSD